jgi:hypothetical protein
MTGRQMLTGDRKLSATPLFSHFGENGCGDAANEVTTAEGQDRVDQSAIELRSIEATGSIDYPVDQWVVARLSFCRRLDRQRGGRQRLQLAALEPCNVANRPSARHDSPEQS